MKVSELTGAHLALWVARALKLEDAQLCGTEPGETPRCEYVHHEEPGDDGWWTEFAPQDDWEEGGPLVDQFDIDIRRSAPAGFAAERWVDHPDGSATHGTATGATRLEAAMRALVASVYGAEVPDEVPA